MKSKPVNRDLPVFPDEEVPEIVRLPIIGDRPSLDFLNTIDWRLNPQRYRDILLSYSDVLAFCLRQNLIGADTYTHLAELALAQASAASRAFTEARAFRDALAAIIDDVAGTPTGAACEQPRITALQLFDEARRRAHLHDTLVWTDNCMHLEQHLEREGLDLPWLLLVRDAEELLCSPLAQRIKVCAADGCGWVFLDTSKNSSRRWCSMQLCGNREKAKRFKQSSETEN
jgi:Conserved protein containing a Zn-ribbon-like motif, possibly RNA-binding